MSLNKLLDIAQRSLFVYQKALEVTSNNIANASDTTYTRQKVIFSSVQANTAETLAVGQGVTISQIQRLRDQYTENQIISYNQSENYEEKKTELLSNLESVLSEPTDQGISNLLGEFFNSWEELSVNPQSSELRTNVVQSAQNLSNKLSSVYEDYTSLRYNLKDEADANVGSINQYLSQIKTLNNQIYQSSVSGANNNALLDQRDAAISELSKIANINVSYDSDNMANISIGGVYAVDRYYNAEFKVIQTDGNLSVQTADGTSTLKLTKGTLGAIVEAANTTIPGYLSFLDSLGNTLVDNVNSIHQTGYTNTDPQLTGVSFFEGYTEGNLEINKNILNDVNYMATSADGTSGNNDIALKIAELTDSKVLNGQTMNSAYTNFVSNIGNAVSTSEQNTQSYSLVLNQLETQRSSYSGVSLDEEMTNVLQYQKSYEASAKLITVADQLFQTLLEVV